MAKKIKTNTRAEKGYQTASIKFRVGKRLVDFKVVTNLTSKGYDVEEIAISWAMRTKDYSAQSFCDYVLEKHIEVTCVPEDNYQIQH